MKYDFTFGIMSGGMVASEQQVPEFDSCAGVCMFSSRLGGFTPGTPFSPIKTYYSLR